ncbi:6-phosphogluconolactonase [Buchnera aphidicola]|uniref:beta-propeller fold lactonase family protein n=1 Tax=Buchnera aphidicola TaxID=9 RepID=UPI0034649B11
MKTIIYVATPGNNQIKILKMGKDLNFNIIQTLNTDGEVQPIHISQNRLYAGVRPKNRIITYEIKLDGKLEKIGESPIPGSPNYLSLDKEKRFLFCASYGMGCLSVSPMNSLGIPENPIQILYNIEGCHYCSTDFNNQYLFVTSLKQNCIYIYDLIDNDLPLNNTPYILHTDSGSGPRHMAFHPNRKYTYSINEYKGTIDVWKLKSNRMLIKSIQNISLLPKKYNYQPWSSDIHINPSGSYLYASDRTANLISIFNINKDNNRLNNIGVFHTEKQPRSFSISPNGQYLVVAGEVSNSITLYEISNNIFCFQKKNQFTVHKRPIWVYIHQF